MSTIVTINATDTITSSRANLNSNFSALNTDKIETSVIDTDTALAANSDSKIPSQKAVKAYTDAIAGLAGSTSGVSAGPASSSTQTITHGLGRTPKTIRINSIGLSTSATTATAIGHSHGTYNSTGNRCIYTTAGASSNPNTGSSTSYAVRLAQMDSGSAETAYAEGVIQNVGATTFDIVWTKFGPTITGAYFIWECE